MGLDSSKPASNTDPKYPMIPRHPYEKDCQCQKCTDLRKDDKAEVDRLRAQLEQLQKENRDLAYKLNTLPEDMKVKRLEGWPEGFVQKDVPFVIPEGTTTLFAKVWTQCVGDGKQSQTKSHVELLNDPDPERKWVPGKTQFQIIYESHCWVQNGTDYGKIIPWGFGLKHTWFHSEGCLKLENVEPKDVYDKDYQLIVNKFMEKYTNHSQVLETQ